MESLPQFTQSTIRAVAEHLAERCFLEAAEVSDDGLRTRLEDTALTLIDLIA